VPERQSRGLEAMYVVAAMVMFVASIFVVVMMFIPDDLFRRTDPGRVYVPGSVEGWSPLVAGDPVEPAGVRDLGGGRFVVVLAAHNWSFEPNEIRVPVGSEVTFRARSMQDYHGIAVVGTPIILSMPQQTVAEATHVFDEAGEYLIVCSEYCGAGHVAMTGRVIVD
jgi:heme/copper-type cytochrome/quinol oxidase subunit 2